MRRIHVADIYNETKCEVKEKEVIGIPIKFSSKGTESEVERHEKTMHFIVSRREKTDVFTSNFVNGWIRVFLDEGLTLLMSNETRIDSIKMWSLNSSFSLTKPLKSLYGKLNQSFVRRLGFTFEFYAVNTNKKPSQFHLRGIPQVLDSFDKPGQEKIAESVNKIEKLFLQNVDYQGITLRFCLKQKNTHVFCSAAYGKGVRLFSQPTKQQKAVKSFE